MDKKPILFALFLVFLTTCKEDDGLDCSLVDCGFQRFSIELLDGEGNNLIANNTYNHSTIVVNKDGTQINSNLNTEDFISFQVLGKVGVNTYKIKLNDAETDTLVLDLSGENIQDGCCGPYFQITSSIYNGESQEIKDENDFYFKKITIIK